MVMETSMRVIIYLASLFLAGLVGNDAALAAMSEWQDIGGGKVRLVAVKDPETRTVSGMVEVKLEPGWKTYWRSPGDSGIPPLFDFSASRGVAVGDVHFPSPQRIEIPSSVFAGYKTDVAFVFDGEALDDDSALTLNLQIGVCEAICIPAMAVLEIPTAALNRSDPRAESAIGLARSFLPREPRPQFTVTDNVRLLDGKLEISANLPSENGRPALFVEGPVEWYLPMPKLQSRDGESAVFTLSLPGSVSADQIRQTRLRYTLVSGKSGVEGDLTIGE